jgi:hypothetical protein
MRKRNPHTQRPIAAMITIASLALVALPLATYAADDGKRIARRPDGRPDLSGMYDIATLTPLQRPAQYGDRLELSPDEAAALTKHWLDNLAKDNEPSDPNRGAPPKGGTDIYVPEFTGAAGEVGGYNAFFVDIGDGTFQVDGKYRTSIIVDPPDGRYPPLSKRGEERRAASAPFRHKNTGTAWWIDMPAGPYDDPEARPLGERCLISRSRSGPPALPAMYNNLKRIVQTDDTLMIMAEQMHDARIIRLEDDHGPNDVHKWMGDSIGHWDGDTLVVETTNFLDQQDRSPEWRVVERFTPQENGSLLYRFTVYDPNYEAPWTGEMPWPATDARLYEYACHEGNYALGGIMRGARILEQDVIEQRAGK